LFSVWWCVIKHGNGRWVVGWEQDRRLVMGMVFGRPVGFSNWINDISSTLHCAAVYVSSDMMSLCWYVLWVRDGVTLAGGLVSLGDSRQVFLVWWSVEVIRGSGSGSCASIRLCAHHVLVLALPGRGNFGMTKGLTPLGWFTGSSFDGFE